MSGGFNSQFQLASESDSANRASHVHVSVSVNVPMAWVACMNDCRVSHGVKLAIFSRPGTDKLFKRDISDTRALPED
jgi:hypothetical protein